MTGLHAHSDNVDEGIDGRSVGELLLDADLTARDLLWDPNPDTAQAKVRTFGEVGEAAAELWAAIPYRDVELSMARIHQVATHLHRTQQRTGWPGTGPTDPHLEIVADNLVRAAELVTARRHPTAPLSATGHLDSEAARTRIMHILYVSSHGVSTALTGHTRALQQRLDTHKALAPGDSIRHARDARERTSAVERLAGSYLHPRWPAALAGAHRDRSGILRLEHAVARWDLQAHRSLAAAPSAANIAHVVRVQQDLALATSGITAAAASRGLRGPHPDTDRVRPALAGLEQAWGRLGTDLGQMIGRQRRLDPELLIAGNNVRAALRDITHDQYGFVSPALMADRVDLRDATTSLQRGLSAAVDLAHVVHDALDDPDLTSSARGAHAMATNTSGPPQGLAAWVTARDLHHDRQARLPPPVRATLLDHAQGVIDTAATADSACAVVSPSPTTRREQSAFTGQRTQDITPPAMDSARGVNAPGIGCE